MGKNKKFDMMSYIIFYVKFSGESYSSKKCKIFGVWVQITTFLHYLVFDISSLRIVPRYIVVEGTFEPCTESECLKNMLRILNLVYYTTNLKHSIPSFLRIEIRL